VRIIRADALSAGKRRILRRLAHNSLRHIARYRVENELIFSCVQIIVRLEFLNGAWTLAYLHVNGSLNIHTYGRGTMLAIIHNWYLEHIPSWFPFIRPF
jgi:hypothetical protein